MPFVMRDIQMIPVQNINYFIALNPTAATNGATLTSANFDMQGFHYAVVEIEGTTSDATNHTPTINLQAANVTNATSFTAVPYYCSGTGATNFTIPNSPTATTSQPYLAMYVDWRSMPRYGNVTITPTTTQTYSIRVLRWRADVTPTAAAQANINTGGMIFGTGGAGS